MMSQIHRQVSALDLHAVWHYSSSHHMPAVPAVSPAPACARLAAGSWLQTACTHAQTHGSPEPTSLVATQPAAVPALSGRLPNSLAGTGHELRCAACWSQARFAFAAACMKHKRILKTYHCGGPLTCDLMLSILKSITS